MFRTILVVHHQEHGIIYCITQFGTIGTIVQASLDSPAVYCTQYNRYNRAGESRLACTVLCNTVYYAVLLMMND